MVFRGQMALLAVMLSGIAISNVFTGIDLARGGVQVVTREPVTWELSSVICIWPRR
jgi:hypothetical protein